MLQDNRNSYIDFIKSHRNEPGYQNYKNHYDCKDISVTEAFSYNNHIDNQINEAHKIVDFVNYKKSAAEIAFFIKIKNPAERNCKNFCQKIHGKKDYDNYSLMLHAKRTNKKNSQKRCHSKLQHCQNSKRNCKNRIIAPAMNGKFCR